MGAANSTDKLTGARSTPLLPLECLLLILRYCEGSTLKNTRLASKAFAILSEPLLWRDIRLIPNADCLSCIGAVLRRSSIAYHIRNVIYDACWEYLIDDFRIKCEKPAFRDKISCADGAEGVLSGTILRQAIQAQIKAGEDDAAEVAYLTRVLRLLSNVQELTVKEASANYEPFESMPYYYRKVCKEACLRASDIRLSGGFGPVDTNHSHTRNFLLAAYSTERDFAVVDLGSVSWHTFFGPPTDVRQPPSHDFRIRKDMFRNIRQLDLSFRGSPSRDFETNLKPLRDLLKSCENLESLYLSFTNLINRRYSTDHRSFSYLSPLVSDSRSRPLMPRLREIYLNSVFCTEHDLIHFLASHASTLRHVSLSNISLLKNDSSDSRGCWVQVIKLMKALLSLDTIYFSGWLSNGGRQIWHVSEDAADERRLRPSVIKYLLDRSIQECPLNHVAIPADHEDLEKPQNGWAEGDWTWTMTYASYKSRSEQTHSGAELFTKIVTLDSDDWAIANPHFWKKPYKKTYPSYPEPYPSKKTSPIPSTWSWSDYGGAKTWSVPTKKGKQEAEASSNSIAAWEWSAPQSDPLSPDTLTYWNAEPAPPKSLSSSGNESPHSASSQASGSHAATSVNNVEPYFPENDLLDFPDEPPPPPTQGQASISANAGSSASTSVTTGWETWSSSEWKQPPYSYIYKENAPSNADAMKQKDSTPQHKSYTFTHSWDWASSSTANPTPNDAPNCPSQASMSSHHSIIPSEALALYKVAQLQAKLQTNKDIAPISGYQVSHPAISATTGSSFPEAFDAN